MSNLRISQLAELAGADAATIDLLAIVDQSASETKSIKLSELGAAIGPLFPDKSIPGSKIDGKLAEGSIDTYELANGSVTAVKLASSSSGLYQARPAQGAHIGQICADNNLLYMWTGSRWQAIDGPNSIITITYGGGPVEIISIDSGNNTAEISTRFVDVYAPNLFLAGPANSGGPVAYRQILGADLPIAQKNVQGAVEVNGKGLKMNGDRIEIDNAITPSNGKFYLVDYNAQGLVVSSKEISVSDLPDTNLAKQFAAGPTASAGAVTYREIVGDDLPTATSINQGAVKVSGNGLRMNSDVIEIDNDIAANTQQSLVSYNSKGLVTGNRDIEITDLPRTNGPREFVAGPTASSGPLDFRQIVGADLPTASNTTQGAVQVGDGLSMTGNLIGIDNTITPSNRNFYLVDYDSNGLIVDSKEIEPADLPLATIDSPGVVMPGTGLTVTNLGELNHLNSVVPGTYPKVTIDAQGHFLQGFDLSAQDIPQINANKITSGTFDPERIENYSLTSAKFADYSTCYIQTTQPATGEYLGQMWLNPETNQLHTYGRSSNLSYWIPVGFGKLSQENLRICGTYDATASTIKTLTSFGTQAGLQVGPIPDATEELTGVYLLCQTGGDAISNEALNGITHTPGDWIVAVGGKWEFIDVGSGGGGGGDIGAAVLNDLLDVDTATAPEPRTNDILIFDADTGLWKNKALDDILPDDAATETTPGIVRLATLPEVVAGVSRTTAISPYNLDQALLQPNFVIDGNSGNGDQDYANGSSQVTPVTRSPIGEFIIDNATEEQAGIVRLATVEETINGVDPTIAITPAGLRGMLDDVETRFDGGVYSSGAVDYSSVIRPENVVEPAPDTSEDNSNGQSNNNGNSNGGGQSSGGSGYYI